MLIRWWRSRPFGYVLSPRWEYEEELARMFDTMTEGR